MAGEFDAEVTVVRDGTEVDGLSIMGLLLLAASPGTTIEIKTAGRQAREALEALTALVEARFREE